MCSHIALIIYVYICVITWSVSAGGGESVPGLSPSLPNVLYCHGSKTTDRQTRKTTDYCLYVGVHACVGVSVYVP